MIAQRHINTKACLVFHRPFGMFGPVNVSQSQRSVQHFFGGIIGSVCCRWKALPFGFAIGYIPCVESEGTCDSIIPPLGMAASAFFRFTLFRMLTV